MQNLHLPDDFVSNEVIVDNQYLNFSVSNFESDLGQTTIPFIDIQNVTTTVPFPMAGVGIYYKRNKNDKASGLIGLKLKSFDFSVHVH